MDTFRCELFITSSLYPHVPYYKVFECCVCWCIVTCDRQAQGRSHRSAVLFLDESFAKGSSANDGGPIPVLQGAASTSLQKPFLRPSGWPACRFRIVRHGGNDILLWEPGPPRIDDEFIAIQEIVCYFDGLLQDSPPLPSQVPVSAAGSPCSAIFCTHWAIRRVWSRKTY